MKSIEEQIKIISKGVDEIINIEDLKNKLERSQKTGKPLTVKLGLDPTAPDIHIGHSVVLRKIRQLQDLGHRAVIIIGDFTGRIGDPTGKSKTRKPLTQEEVMFNARTYEEQIFKIIDKDKTDLKFNSEWLGKLSLRDTIELTSKYTVARMLEREDFKKRFESHSSIGIHEFFYPLLQAFDSVTLKADIELGGTDQRFNLLMGRTIQKDFDQESQVAILMPLLEGTDGKDKMSKSLGNYIGINEDANDIYGKVMSIPDEMIIKYYELATDIHPDEVAKIKEKLEEENVNPRDMKMELAKEIVRLYHGEEEAIKAEENFKNIFQQGNIPEDIDILKENLDEINIIDLIVKAKFAPSKNEARRLVKQGAVKINGEKVDEECKIKNEDILQVGKKKFIKILSEN
ncbi:tyrosine--tRNA ligase [Clostridium sporogenes]|uniref:Tyrosine--tRNA ligase n=1 Tax=Clostridium botulinum TaxID=1491 RepID=A0A6M0SYW3_CLOBO|nr:tyrosine--tRNA ligase [Clostridium sporogenes]NFA60454.1 tyrosine--tRNA ligase [Clostridium botulinum]NFI72273.1 tyrosine--tRNA ligase [Clostridium sporogenes]NFL72613.1 tyrosine--tRNA ligase [Clostridium sporogenes]NFM24536.1 tyrosine--tRNA ligase [Clostridium sporogenes]NFP60879.1 tyrosine--tRNA ligase [Clostridium sporogenes]